MVTINLIEALQAQMGFCERIERYRCGIYVATELNESIVIKVIGNLLPDMNIVYGNTIQYLNGSMIRVTRANDSQRGQRFHGIIIDSSIVRDVITTTILPCLIPLKSKDGTLCGKYSSRDRVHYYSISRDDIIESEKHKKLTFVSSEWKEYECMFYDNDYNSPVIEKEVNNNKVLLYEAWGIPKNMITYETEFVNKTKQTYLNIKGEFKNEIIGFENDINIHLRIDTYIYDGYEVHIEDGLVTVTLHEIKNEAPVLKDYGVA